jgi:hypothetical protein
MNPDMPDDVEIGYSSSRKLPLVALIAAPPPHGAANDLRVVIESVVPESTAMGFDSLGIWVGGVAANAERRAAPAPAVRRARSRASKAEPQRAITMDCAVRIADGTGAKRSRSRWLQNTVPCSCGCCGGATSRKNQNLYHQLAQELGKLPVRNSVTACVVHCARNPARCPIGSLCRELIRDRKRNAYAPRLV